MKAKQYTTAQFADKIGVSRATIWRWVTKPEQAKYLKMYDAKKVIIAGKTFIEV